LIGNRRCRPSLAIDRRGRELEGSQHGPGSIYFASDDITSERKEDLEHPTQRHVRKKLGSYIRTNRLQIEWIALGYTAERFWTARRRRIAALESQPG
jgi:hypothetical protein